MCSADHQYLHVVQVPLHCICSIVKVHVQCTQYLYQCILWNYGFENETSFYVLHVFLVHISFSFEPHFTLSSQELVVD